MKFLTLLFAVIALCTASAFADPATDIIGKWTDSETGGIVEYKEQGRIEQTLPSGEILRGRYAFVDETHIFIHLVDEMMPTAPVVTPITIDGDDLQMVDSDGKKVKKLKRQKTAKDPE